MAIMAAVYSVTGPRGFEGRRGSDVISLPDQVMSYRPVPKPRRPGMYGLRQSTRGVISSFDASPPESQNGIDEIDTSVPELMRAGET
jgi:hypothetical protein